MNSINVDGVKTTKYIDQVSGLETYAVDNVRRFSSCNKCNATRNVYIYRVRVIITLRFR